MNDGQMTIRKPTQLGWIYFSILLNDVLLLKVSTMFLDVGILAGRTKIRIFQPSWVSSLVLSWTIQKEFDLLIDGDSGLSHQLIQLCSIVPIIYFVIMNQSPHRQDTKGP